MSSFIADEHLIFGTLSNTPSPIVGDSLNGVVLPFAFAVDNANLYLSLSTAGTDLARPASAVAASGFLVSGTLSDSPAPVAGDALVGVQVPTYFDYFYNRIHLTPNGDVNLGVVVGSRTTDVLIWNAYTDQGVTITDMPLTGSANTVKSGAPGLPYVMDALTTVNFDLITSAATADFSFTTTLTVVESTGQAPFLTLTGLASLVLGLKPERPLTSSLEWATNIITSSNGKEQRQTLRTLPRESHTLRYRPLETASKNLLRNQLLSHHNKAFGLPVWMEERPLGTDAVSADTTIFLDTAYARFAAAEPVILWVSETNYAVNQVDTVLSDRLTLSREVGGDFPAGITKVIPMVSGQATGNVSGQIVSPQFEFPEFTLQQTDQLPAPAYSPPASHDGEPVLLLRPIANRPLSLSQSIDRRDVDYGLGTFSRNPQWGSPKDVREHRFILRTQQELWEFRTFLFWLKGRGETFYVPTFQDDLVQSAAISSSDTAFDIENHGFSSLVYGNTQRGRDIAFLLPDGTYITRSVTSAVTLDADTDRVQINSALGGNYNVGDLQISMLRRVRLVSDRVEITHQREDRTSVSLLLVSVDE